MNIIVFGPPGAGKGTQCRLMADKYGLYQLSTGDLIRKEIADETELGVKVKAIVESGAFPSTDMVNQMVVTTIHGLKNYNGIVFDGYPRTLEQGEFLDRFLSQNDMRIDLAVMLEVNEEDVVSRIVGRYQCSKCGEVYSENGRQPKQDGVCDKCGNDKFAKRADDTAEVMRTRLATYHRETEDIIDYYEQQGFLIRIDGNRSIEAVQAEIEGIIDKKQTKRQKRSVNMVDL